jgi:small subunit ribosomal protein S16
MVRIRMTRMGKRSHPFYRVGVFDQKTARDGAAIEILGFYDPFAKEAKAGFKIEADRLRHWLSVGAQPSDKMVALLRNAGVSWRKEPAPKKTGKATGKKP